MKEKCCVFPLFGSNLSDPSLNLFFSRRLRAVTKLVIGHSSTVGIPLGLLRDGSDRKVERLLDRAIPVNLVQQRGSHTHTTLHLSRGSQLRFTNFFQVT